MDLSCPLQGGYNQHYREVNGVRWPIHQDIDPANPLGVERPEAFPRPRADAAPLTGAPALAAANEGRSGSDAVRSSVGGEAARAEGSRP